MLRKVLAVEILYTVSMPEKNLDSLEQARSRIRKRWENDDVSIVHSRK